MDRIVIRGGRPLKGEIQIGGAKNAALPLMAASLLTSEPLRLSNLPHLADISTMAKLLRKLGVEISMDGNATGGGPGGPDGQRQALAAEPLQGRHAEVLQQRLPRPCQLECVGQDFGKSYRIVNDGRL